MRSSTHTSTLSFDRRVQDLLVIFSDGPAHPVKLEPREDEHADHDDQRSEDVVHGRDHPQHDELQKHGHHDLQMLHGADQSRVELVEGVVDTQERHGGANADSHEVAPRLAVQGNDGFLHDEHCGRPPHGSRPAEGEERRPHADSLFDGPVHDHRQGGGQTRHYSHRVAKGFLPEFQRRLFLASDVGDHDETQAKEATYDRHYVCVTEAFV